MSGYWTKAQARDIGWGSRVRLVFYDGGIIEGRVKRKGRGWESVIANEKGETEFVISKVFSDFGSYTVWVWQNES